MRQAMRGIAAALGSLIVAMQLGGCPTTSSPLEFVAGGTGEATILRSTPEVDVLTPVSDLSVSGGTQVEVNWRAFARTRTSVINVIVDPDQDPNNGNEIVAFSNLSLTTTSALVDTTTLENGTYFIGVVLVEVGNIAAFGYAPGRVTIDQRPTLFYNEPTTTANFSARANLAFDRTQAIIPRFEVSWTLNDPDSTDTVDIYLDPDEQPNGNEVLLYHSTSQTTDSFTFDLPTSEFAAGTYRILALVTDGLNKFPFYAPGRIVLRSRLAGFYDLRNLELGNGDLSGAVFEGFNPRDNAGSFVQGTGDLDSDGFGDFIIMSQFAKPRYTYNAQRTGIGEAYLIYGRSKRFQGSINLNSAGSLFRAEVYTGPPEVPDPVRPSRGVTSFAVLSDWDGDGVREMAFGLPFTDSVSISGFIQGQATINYAPLDASGYFRTGAVVIAAGSSLRPDLGFPGGNVFNLAEFGTVAHMPITAALCPEGLTGPKAPSSFGGSGFTLFNQHLVGVDGTANIGAVRLGCRFSSVDFGDQFGETVSSWDFDGIVMAAPNRDPAVSVLTAPSIAGGGVISVFFDDVKSGFYPWTNDNAPPANTARNYPGSQQSAGNRLLPHGGPYHYLIDDLTWSPGFTVDPDDQENPCSAVVDARIETPVHSVRFWSSMPGARLSNARGIRDFNGDGLLDLLIGAPQANAGAGACYIILGRLRDLIQGGALQLEELSLPMNGSNSGTQRIFNGVQILGNPGERLGQAQDDAGDFNGDGFDDVVIGSPLLNNGQGGAVVFFGSRDVVNLTQAEIPFSEIPARGLGVILIGENEGDLAGARVARAGDIDGDGNSDILIAAPDRSVRLDLDQDGYPEIDREKCGVVYLVYGSPDLITHRSLQDDGTLTAPGVLLLRDVGTATLPGAVFIGRDSDDFLGSGLGLEGDRTFGIATAGDVDGDGHGDLLIGSVSASPRSVAQAGEAYLLYGTGN